MVLHDFARQLYQQSFSRCSDCSRMVTCHYHAGYAGGMADLIRMIETELGKIEGGDDDST